MTTIMKKLINKYFGVLCALILVTGCTDPLEDEINAIETGFAFEKDIEYTLTDDDYDLIDEECDCTGFGNFSSDEDVRAYIPLVLANNFPALGGSSSAVVTYDFFNGSSPYLGTVTEYTVSDQEYEDLGYSFGSFSNLEEDLPIYANFKVTGTPSNGDYLDVTHDYYNGSFTETDVVSRVVYTVAYGWMYAEPLPDDSYSDFFNESPPDFSFEDEGEEKIPFWLKETKVFVEEGDRIMIQWNWDNGPGTSQSVAVYILTGGEWIVYGDIAQTTQESLNFGFNGTDWEPDNTIKYTLGSDDYVAIAAAYASLNPDGSSSMSTFNNYDLTLWSSQEIFDSITARLETLNPSIEAGQKYLVEYAVWRPGAGTDQINVEYNGSEWVDISGE